MKIPDQLKHLRFIRVKDKAPIDKGWQLEVGGANFPIDDTGFNEYLEKTHQYGVLCGYNGLIVIDFDDQGMMDEVLGLGILPKTFSVKTARKGLLHLYYYTDNCASWKILDKDKNTLADIQGKTKQVIGPGSRIPDGREYIVVDDLPIATIPSTLIHEALDRFDFHKNEEALVATESLTLDDFTKKFGEDTTLQEIKKQLRISDVLRDKGISTSKNPTKCPLHDSKGGKCFGFDDTKGVFHCFHCLKRNVKVWTINGYKKAEDVIRGDIVLNALGERVKVRRVEKQHPKEKLLKIYTVASRIPLEVSEKHGMVIIKNTNCGVRTKKVSCNPDCSYLKYRKENKGKKCAKQKFEEYKLSEQIPADTITTNDSLVYPIPKYSKDVLFINILGSVKKESFKLELTNELLWILGLWVAEGNAQRSKIQFSLHREETEYAELIINYFKKIGINGSIHHNSGTNSKIVSVFNTPLERKIVELFGKGCNNKKIPRFILDLPPERLNFFINGIFDGDGTKKNNENIYYINQTSEELAYNLFEAGLKLGYHPTISRHEREYNNTKNPRKPNYIVNYCLNGKGRHTGAFRFKGWYVMPITKIETSPNDEEFLIDIGVEGGHKTFLTAQGISHNCGEKGDVITLWQLVHGVTDFVEAKKSLCEELSIEDNYIPPPLVAPIKNTLPSVQLPQDNRTLAQFAKSLATHFVGCEDLFFKVDERCIVEITEYFDKQLKQLIVGFSMVEPKRLLNLIEAKVNMYNLVKVKKGQVEVRRTPTEQIIKLLSANTEFLKALYEIKRFLNYPIPFITSENELIIPGKGYDKRYQAYFTPNTPELVIMNPLEAKEVIMDLLSEFCFKDVLDRDMAISYLITPMCRGLYHSSNARTPLFIIQANRERAGKDYLAGVVGIIYEGRAIDDTPLVTGDKGEANNDEWRKKFTSALKAGRRRIHSSNNRGFLNSAVLEQFLTSEVWTDRQLGSNTSLELNNEIDISLSANIGLTYTPDLWFRARPINLFYGEENPNERIYKRTDLWGYIKNNRGLILSAIYTLIKTWIDAGSPKSSIPFTSFPEWSRVIGGIMEYHAFSNPCINIEDDGIGGDKETQSMKELFTFMADYTHNHPEIRGFTVSDIRRIVMEAQSSEDFEGFSGWDLSDKSFQTKFGVAIKRYVGRMFNCKSSLLGDTKVKLIIGVENNRAARVLYVFKIEKVNNNGIIGEVKENSGVEEVSIGESMPEQISDMDRLIGILSGRDMCNIDYLRINGVNDKTIKKALAYKIAFEPRSGFIKLLK